METVVIREMLKMKLKFKKMIAATIFLAGSFSIFAQDIIFMKNGSEIQAIVREVGIEDISYKRFNYQNGPTYRLKKSEISMIKYEDGNQDIFDNKYQSNNNRQQRPENQRNYYRNDIDFNLQPWAYKYTFGRLINPYGPEKSPFLAGFLSALVPGVGQFYNGDAGAGLLFMGCNIACNLIWMNAISTDYYGNKSVDRSTFTVAFVGAIIVQVSSIVNGAQVAKRVNRTRGYYLGENTHLQIQPAIIQQQSILKGREYAYGMNFSLNF